jgi:hypothetical protein
MKLSKEEFDDYMRIVKSMALNCRRKLKKPPHYTTDELVGEAFVTILKLAQRIKKKGVEPGTEEFKYTMIKSVSNTFKMLVNKSYRVKVEKKMPKVVLDPKNVSSFLVQELIERFSGQQLEYIKFLLSPPIDLVEMIRNQSHKESMRTIREYLDGLPSQKERKLRQSIYLTLTGDKK